MDLKLTNPDPIQFNFNQAAELRSTCDDFLKSVTELRKISDSIVAIFDSVSKEVEREKISAIGARNLLR